VVDVAALEAERQALALRQQREMEEILLILMKAA
jgi:hypothetical protein